MRSSGSTKGDSLRTMDSKPSYGAAPIPTSFHASFHCIRRSTMTMKQLAAVTIMVALMAMQAASAVDITGFVSTTACSGDINTAYPNHPDGACAPFAQADAGSVLITGLTRCKQGIVFDVDCADVKARRTGPPASVCFIGGGYTSAMWRTVVGCVE